MKKPTEMLSEEHQHILKVIDAMETECGSIESGKAVDSEFFRDAVDFIRNYADRFHHSKEEDILFKELCKDTVQLHCNPVEQMLYEHDLGRKFVKGIEEGLKKGSKTKVVENARGYSDLLREHIYKEDNVLYPMADMALGNEAQKSMIKKFKEAEEKKFSKGTKERYLDIANKLGRRNTRRKTG